MKKTYKISGLNTHTGMPFNTTIVWAMALSYWHAPQWLCGAAAILLLFWWIVCIITTWNAKLVDIFNPTDFAKAQNGKL